MTENLLFFDFQQLLLMIIVIFLGLGICLSITEKKLEDVAIVTLIYFWHTLFSFYYWYYTLSNTADALLYFKKTFRPTVNFSPGTAFTEALTYVIRIILDSNYLNTTLVFNIFGSLGLVLLYKTLKKFFTAMNRYWIILLFLPSASFWSAGLGKDGIAFLATCLFLYAVVKTEKSVLSVIIAFVLMFMVRPHIAAIMLLSYIVYFVINSKVHLILKVLTLPVIAVGLYFALSFAQQYVGLENASLATVGSYVDQRQGYNLEGGSSTDLASMSYPVQMFTYIFRPLPFEASSLLTLVTSLENTIYLLLFIYILLKSKFNLRYYVEGKNLWLFIYLFLTCTILAITTANLGIATRQKWMFMPVLIYLLLYAYNINKINQTRVIV